MSDQFYGLNDRELELLLKSVDDFKMSTRLRNCCEHAGVGWVWQMVKLNKAELLAEEPRRFGPKSIKEMEELLLPIGLSMGRNFTREQLTFLNGCSNPAGTA
ncbi:MAG: DNA-directed RNA polymerase subunit alpha C-terminal domain-containing protein [Patescibacteria group bacterium]|jgi:DNA-directed RNA polymerase alpha subunit